MNNDNRIDELENDVTQLQRDVTELRIDTAQIKGTLLSLAKQEDVAAIKSQIPHFATHADITRLLMWLIGVGIGTMGTIVMGILNYLK